MAMKPINEYLLGKDKKLTDDVPKTPKFDDWVEFLESNGFAEVRTNRANKFIGYLEIAVFSFNPICMIMSDFSENCQRIMFSNGGKIGRSNPLFTLWTTRSGKDPVSTGDVAYVANIEYSDHKNLKYEEFVEIAKEHFEW